MMYLIICTLHLSHRIDKKPKTHLSRDSHAYEAIDRIWLQNRLARPPPPPQKKKNMTMVGKLDAFVEMKIRWIANISYWSS